MSKNDLTFEAACKKMRMHIQQKEKEMMALPCFAWRYEAGEYEPS